MDIPARINQPEPEKTYLAWTADSRPFKKHDKKLFSTVLVIASLVCLILAFAQEWMLIATIIALVFAYYVWSMVPPEKASYAITSKGVKIGTTAYKWEDLNRWWLEDKWGYELLVIDSPTITMKRLYLVVDEQSKETIVEAMTKNLLMEKPEDTALDKMGRWLMTKFPLEAR